MLRGLVINEGFSGSGARGVPGNVNGDRKKWLWIIMSSASPKVRRSQDWQSQIRQESYFVDEGELSL